MGQTIIDILQQLKPEGPRGFEGLIARLFSHVTGQLFHLAQAGTQGGRDMSSRAPSANVIAVECKRYGSDTALNERELLGEIVQVTRAIPDLDMWVLVASREVSSQLREALQHATQVAGIELCILAHGDGAPSSLDVLCAQAPAIVTDFVQEHLPDKISQLTQSLTQIENHPGYKMRLTDLKTTLTTPLIGCAAWRREQNSWLNGVFQSAAETHAHFGQLLNVGDAGVRLIARQEAWKSYDNWFEMWQRDHQSLVVVGEEGDGKTWATAAWLQRIMEQDPLCPPVVLVASSELATNDPEDLLVQAVAQRTRGMGTDHTSVRKRVVRWAETHCADRPLCVLVLDGVNEHHSVTRWRELLEQLQLPRWRTTLAVIVTCRTAYWQANFAPLRSIPVKSYTLPSYNDDELAEALDAHQLRRGDIRPDLLDLARKPRYFDLLVRYRARLTESGDVTVARLIYEDWRDRWERKRNTSINNDDFQNLLRDLARRHLDGETRVRIQQIGEELPFSDERTVAELRTSGVFHEHRGTVRVQEPHLILALALLLVDHVEDAAHNDENMTETIASWLEPQTEMDIKAQICEAATLQALQMPDLPTAAKAALLSAWVTNQNSGPSTLSAYFPLNPDSYFVLAENVWSDAGRHARGQTLLMQTFLRWIQEDVVAHRPLWNTYCERWLGLVHRAYYPYIGERTEADTREMRQALTERLGRTLELGDFTVAGYRLTAIDDDELMGLAHVALALISHIPRAPFIRAFATSCVAEAVMDHSNRYKALAWIVRTSPSSVSEAMVAEVRSLLTHSSSNQRIVQQAAYRLLEMVGSAEAHGLQQTLPTDLFPPHPLAMRHAHDPCVSGVRWQREDCEQCMTRIDLDPQWIARQIAHACMDPDLPAPSDIGERLAPLAETIDVTSMQVTLMRTAADHAFDEYEAALCAYASVALADLIRRLVHQITERSGMALRQLSLVLRKHHLILTEEENRAITDAWSQLHTAEVFPDNATETAELFLFPEVFRHKDAQEQLALLIDRPAQRQDLVVLRDYCKPVTDWDRVWEALATTSQSETKTRILWMLSTQTAAIPSHDVITHIVPCVTDDQSLVRARALHIIFETQDAAARTRVVEGSWCWDMTHDEEENHWGSLILGVRGSHLSFDEIIRRVHPVYLGYAVRCRGNVRQEVTTYADSLHQQWLALSNPALVLPADVPTIYLETSARSASDTTPLRRDVTEHPSTHTLTSQATGAAWGGVVAASERSLEHLFGKNFAQQQQGHFEIGGDFAQQQQDCFNRFNETQRQQGAASNYWFAQRFFDAALDQILLVAPQRIDEWVMDALDERSDAEHRLQRGSTFYEALGTTLLASGDTRGLVLYKRMQQVPLVVRTRDKYTAISLIDYALFQAPSETMEVAWQQRLAQCTTDQELLEVVIAAQVGRGSAWLWSYINHALEQTDAPRMSMYALTLLGLLDTEDSQTRLAELQNQVPDTWIRTLVHTSQARWQHNTWAKHWLERFLTIPDDHDAWAAFQLFLRCVDRRFWIWYEPMMDALGARIPHHRHSYLSYTLGEIVQRSKKNERPLAEQFLGQPVQKNALWPWM